MCYVYTNIEIASVNFEICIVREPTTTSGPGLLLARDTGLPVKNATRGGLRRHETDCSLANRLELMLCVVYLGC